jgi:N-methylhydantoinase B/oxoprolinase/acetone carboxylase alpha subunit
MMTIRVATMPRPYDRVFMEACRRHPRSAVPGARVLRYRLRRGSGGAGAAPGGVGIERDLQVLDDCTVSLITERRVSAPPRLARGAPGAPGENWLLSGANESRAERLPDRCTGRLQAGDVLGMLTPGGGGWGAPGRAT